MKRLWGNIVWWVDDRINHWFYDHGLLRLLFSRRLCDYNDRLLLADGYVCWGKVVRNGGGS